MDTNSQIEEVLNKHKGLLHHSESNLLIGELSISSGDSYDVRIELDGYPKLFPIVYETGGRIPLKLDRHIYLDSGSCCFTTRAKSQVLLNTKITSLLKFINEVVIRYFENNSYYEINGKYCFDEYDHGALGVLQAYQDILNISAPKIILSLMAQRVMNKKLHLKDLCYCSSGQSLKKCSSGLHERSYRAFRLIDKQVLEEDLYFLHSKLPTLQQKDAKVA